MGTSRLEDGGREEVERGGKPMGQRENICVIPGERFQRTMNGRVSAFHLIRSLDYLGAGRRIRALEFKDGSSRRLHGSAIYCAPNESRRKTRPLFLTLVQPGFSASAGPSLGRSWVEHDRQEAVDGNAREASFREAGEINGGVAEGT